MHGLYLLSVKCVLMPPISPPLVSYGNIWTSSCGVPPYWTFEINYCLVPMHPFPWKSPWKPFLTVSELVLVVKLCKCFYTVGCMIFFFHCHFSLSILVLWIEGGLFVMLGGQPTNRLAAKNQFRPARNQLPCFKKITTSLSWILQQ